MKLTRKKLVETLRQIGEGKTSYQARKVAGISVRRVNQVREEYFEKGEIPEIGKAVGRPRKMIEKWELNLVKRFYGKYRVSADTLERLIDRDTSKHIGHNRIHQILLELGCAKHKGGKGKRKKYRSYQRRHSLTAVHIDWHCFKGQWIFAVIDDASRKILALVETTNATTVASKEGMEIALKHGKIKQCISDHGAQFVANIIDAEAEFTRYLKEKGIKQILCRVKYPQSNGKIERWFECYDRHREAFKTQEAFLHWYNDLRPHRSLKFDILETPSQAFIRKLKK
jgi:putative transposase